MIQNEWNGRTGVCPSRVLQREKLKGGLNNRKWTIKRTRKSFFKKKKNQKGIFSMCDGGWGPHPQQLSNYTHVISRRWDPILVGDMVKIDGFPDGSRPLSPDRSTYSLSFFNAFWNTAAQVHRRRAKNPPPSALIENATINRSFDDGHTTTSFFFFSFFMFLFFEFPAQHANALLLASFR